jgi:hypothetical protein
LEDVVSQLRSADAALQHEVEADWDGSVHSKRHVPTLSVLMDPLALVLAPVSAEISLADSHADESDAKALVSTSNMPELMTHSA